MKIEIKIHADDNETCGLGYELVGDPSIDLVALNALFRSATRSILGPDYRIKLFEHHYPNDIGRGFGAMVAREDLSDTVSG